jgi:hypothetical protein
MLRWMLIGYGLLYMVGAAVLLFVIHASVFVGVYLAVNGLIVVSALFVERRRYRSQGDRTQGDFQSTGERFVDPTTQRFMEVFYNPATGEREYREVTK